MILKNLISVGAFTALMFAASAFAQKEEIKKIKPVSPSENKGFAVLELFTSEGCSSCPPADELMEQIEKEYGNQQVFILSYHVDYWNRLGWKDRFSSAENSQRQQWYSRLLQSQTYTPQLVVNGKKELVGSDRNSIENALQHVLADPKNTPVNLSAKESQKTITASYKTTETDSQSKLLISLIEKKSSTQVGGGENEGHRLQHWQIVHQQEQISLKDHSEGTVYFKLPDNFSSENWEIIGFIQNLKTGKISGASKSLIQ
ncbi:DUF1223 domain-containing protein [Chryseobacterium sp. L7]|uniref:DUF1223 domain-containing protein n=1 Tax=Chryseobacterium endalhagicum TaxID=2797638 RepID=A0ABS1QDY3_9FLAO|nr:DUF1223 domain-containing protein [Chryseobacterium endalhagicum]MBL1220512.1 DUF1223 domain-containing protein [Chryseobacterium endalhagicum]